MGKKHKSYGIFLFIICTFIIPLICILLIAYVPVFQKGILQFVLFAIQGASPTIAAISISTRDGFTGLKYFLIEKYRQDFSIKLCLIGFMTPALLLTMAKLITYLTPYNNQFITIPSLKKITIILWALIAEELGWRGYLQEKVEDKWGNNFTPAIVGLIWASWHYHFFFLGTMDIPILAFTYGCVLESYGYYVMTKLSKGNIVPASLWHFSGNLFFNLYLFNPNWNKGSIIPYIIVDSLYTVYLGIFIYLRKKHLD